MLRGKLNASFRCEMHAHAYQPILLTIFRDRAYAKDKFITSLVFHTQTVKGKKTTYLVSSGPYHLMHMWRVIDAAD